MSGAHASVAYDDHQPGLAVKASLPAEKAIRSVEVLWPSPPPVP
jgi:hypothetical protein